MQLRALPIDLWRPILDRLELNDYVRLWNTFDIGIHKTFSFSHAFTQIHLYIDYEVSRIDVYNFLTLVRNVGTLSVDKSLKWPPHLLRLFTTLNPLRLHICATPLDGSAASILHRYLDGRSDKSERSIARLLTPSLLPKFSRLMPRLEHLELTDPTSDTSKRNTTKSSMLESPWKDVEPFESRLSYYRFPVTSLTSFAIDCVNEDVWYTMSRSLPVSLRVLSLRTNFCLDLVSLVDRFPSLEDLDARVVDGCDECPEWESSNSEATFPSTLRRLSISANNPCYAKTLLLDSHFATSNASELEIHASLPSHRDNRGKTLDLGSLLPPTITKLLFRLHHYATLLTVPASLVSLDLSTQDIEAPQLASILSSLNNLVTLQLTLIANIDIIGSGDTPRSRYLSTLRRNRSTPIALFHLLPKRLTSLVIEGGSNLKPSKSAIEDLPQTLERLELPYFNLKMIDVLRRHLPSGHLTISEPIELWNSSNGRYLQSPEVSSLWSSVVDLDAWADAMNRHYSDLHTRFIINFTSKKLKQAKNTTEVDTLFLTSGPESRHGSITLQSPYDLPHFGHILDGFPNLRRLLVRSSSPATSYASSSPSQRQKPSYCNVVFPLSKLPSSMTYLEVFDPKILIQLDTTLVTSRITFIATSTYFTVEEGVLSTDLELLPNLTFLDAPNWRVPSAWALKLLAKDMERLAVEVSMYDYEVVDFLTSDKVVCLRNRPNVDVSICYTPTGYWLPSSWWSGTTEVTWSSMKDETKILLSNLLSTEKLPADVLSIGRNAQGPIGSNLNRITCSSSFKRRQVCLPSSAKSVILMGSRVKDWKLVTAVKLKERTTPDSPRVGAFSEFPTNLVRLELEGVIEWSDWRYLLPDGLEYLRVRVNLNQDDLGLSYKFVRLKVLVMECTSIVVGRDRFKDPHFSIPESVQHLCLSLPHCMDAWSYLNFYSLKTLFIASPTLQCARKLRKKRMTGVAQLDRFDIVYQEGLVEQEAMRYSRLASSFLSSVEEVADPDDKFVVVRPVADLKRAAPKLVDDYCRRIEEIWND